jgi:hypothetical protein
MLPSIEPLLDDVMRRLGYNAKKTIADEDTIRLVYDLITQAVNLTKPVGNTLDLNLYEIIENKIHLEKGITLVSGKLAGVLSNCRKITLIAGTIGQRLPERIKEELKNERLLESVILDASASEAVEAFINYIQRVLEQENHIQGFKPSMRYSPGFGDLKIEVQKLILPLLEADKIGITYNPENFILQPEKSITAIIGWYK